MAKEAAEDSWAKVDLTAPPELADALGNFMTEIGAEGICQEAPSPMADEFEATRSFDTITAYLPGKDLDSALASLEAYLEDIQDMFPSLDKPAFTITRISNSDWGEEWKKYFHPFRIGKHLVVKPTWEPFQQGDSDIIVEIDPGMAFGTGQHHSTAMCLEALEDLMAVRQVPAGKVLDVGTGTGILGIAAAKLGAQFVECLDIDEQAVAIAVENAILNRVAERLAIHQGSIAALQEVFDVIVANLTAKLLIELHHHLEYALKPGGYLIISGIIEKQGQDIEELFSRPPLHLQHLLKSAEWRCYVFCKE